MVQIVALAFLLRGMLIQGADRIAFQADMMHLKSTGVAFWFTVLVLATLVSPKWAQWPFANRPMRWLGTISYGVYVFHLIFIRFAVHTLGYSTDGSTGAFLKLLAFTAAGCLVAGHVAHVLVERPVRRWAVRITRAPARAPKPLPAPEPLPLPPLEPALRASLTDATRTPVSDPV
jgi:peptidoglycan/LPS O-acetylase OafA/YrhL